MKKLILLFGLAIALQACTDSSTNPNGSSLLPMGTGNYWINKSYGKTSPEEWSRDSVVVTGTIEKEGKTGSVFASYDEDGDFVGEDYFREEGDALYTWSGFSNAFGDNLPVDFGFDDIFEEQWYKVADPGDDFWKIDEAEDLEINVMGFTATGDIEITGEKTGSENLKIEGRSYSTDKFEIKAEFDGTVNFQGFPIQAKIAIILKLNFSPGIGLVRSETEIELPAILDEYFNPDEMSDITELIDYNI